MNDDTPTQTDVGERLEDHVRKLVAELGTLTAHHDLLLSYVAARAIQLTKLGAWLRVQVRAPGGDLVPKERNRRVVRSAPYPD
jgi:hypothetical protein